MKDHDSLKAFIELGYSVENRIYMSGEKRSVLKQGENEDERRKEEEGRAKGADGKRLCALQRFSIL